MATKKPGLHARLATEDAARSVRLKEEILGRVEVIARIVARVQGKPPALPIVAFTRREERASYRKKTTAAAVQWTYHDGSIVRFDAKAAMERQDQARILEHLEEIDGRASELARIVARNLRLPQHGPLAQFTVQSATQDEADLVQIEILYSDGSQGCIDEANSTCCEGPCPC